MYIRYAEGFTESFVTHPGGLSPIATGAAPSDDKMLGIAVAVTTINQEAGELMVRVAFDRDDAVVGILFLPVNTPAESIPF